MSMLTTKIVVEFGNFKQVDYLITLLSESNIEWKNAQIHNTVLETLMNNSQVVPLPVETKKK